MKEGPTNVTPIGTDTHGRIAMQEITVEGSGGDDDDDDRTEIVNCTRRNINIISAGNRFYE